MAISTEMLTWKGGIYGWTYPAKKNYRKLKTAGGKLSPPQEEMQPYWLYNAVLKQFTHQQ